MESRVTDRGSMRRYRTEIPNIIDDMDLSVYAYRLYMKLKRVAGDDGKCYYTARELAEQCRMSPGTVSKAKRELLEADLIRIETGDRWTRDNITIVDMWPANFAYFAQEKEAPTPDHHMITPDHHMITPDHHMITPDHHMITKEEPIKQEPVKRGAAPLPPLRSPRASKSIKHKSPHVDLAKFDNGTGYIPRGVGATAVEIYYERFDIRRDRARLSDPQEDDLVMFCPNLDRLREVITAYSQTPYQPGNVRLILEWYRDGIPQKHRVATPGQSSNNGTAAVADYLHEMGGF